MAKVRQMTDRAKKLVEELEGVQHDASEARTHDDLCETVEYLAKLVQNLVLSDQPLWETVEE